MLRVDKELGSSLRITDCRAAAFTTLGLASFVDFDNNTTVNSSHTRVSVVLLCHNQLPNLAGILRSLRAQTVKPDEVIIADDDSRAPIEQFATRSHCQYVRTQRPPEFRSVGMRALARQIGTLRTRGDVVLYLDGDIIPSRGVIELALQCHERKRHVAVKVPRRYQIANSKVLPVTNWTTALPESKTLFQSFYSDCFSISRGALSEVGGWDTHFAGWGEEDVEFGFRCQTASIPLLFPDHPKLFTTHINHRVDHVDKFSSLVRNLAYFRKKYPDSRAVRTYTRTALQNYAESFAEFLAAQDSPMKVGNRSDGQVLDEEIQCRSQLAIPDHLNALLGAR